MFVEWHPGRFARDPAPERRYELCTSNIFPSPTSAVLPDWILIFRSGWFCLPGERARQDQRARSDLFLGGIHIVSNTCRSADRQFHEAKKNTLAVTRLVAEYQHSKSKHRLEARLILEPTGVNGQRLRKEILLDGVKKSAQRNHRSFQCGRLRAADVTDHRRRT